MNYLRSKENTTRLFDVGQRPDPRWISDAQALHRTVLALAETSNIVCLSW
jgi:hypothetical protein